MRHLLLFLFLGAAAHAAVDGINENCGRFAVSTSSTQIIPAITTSGKRVSLLVKNPAGSATVYLSMGRPATQTNSIPLAGGDVYSEALPVIDNRSVHILGTSNGFVYVEEKVQ